MALLQHQNLGEKTPVFRAGQFLQTPQGQLSTSPKVRCSHPCRYGFQKSFLVALKVFLQPKHALLVPLLQDGSTGVDSLSQQRSDFLRIKASKGTARGHEAPNKCWMSSTWSFFSFAILFLTTEHSGESRHQLGKKQALQDHGKGW